MGSQGTWLSKAVVELCISGQTKLSALENNEQQATASGIVTRQEQSAVSVWDSVCEKDMSARAREP